MRAKIFIISIPMLPIEALKCISYETASEPAFGRIPVKNALQPQESRFPGIFLLRNNLTYEADNIKIVTVRTLDINGNSEICYKYFKSELEALSGHLGVSLNIDTEILIPADETEKKEKIFLDSLFSCFEKSSDIYMDLSFGTKITAIEMFSALNYAEIVQKCSIRSVVYGNYDFSGSSKGTLYELTKLYHIIRFLNSAEFMEKKVFKNLVEQLLK